MYIFIRAKNKPSRLPRGISWTLKQLSLIHVTLSKRREKGTVFCMQSPRDSEFLLQSGNQLKVYSIGLQIGFPGPSRQQVGEVGGLIMSKKAQATLLAIWWHYSDVLVFGLGLLPSPDKSPANQLISHFQGGWQPKLQVMVVEVMVVITNVSLQAFWKLGWIFHSSYCHVKDSTHVLYFEFCIVFVAFIFRPSPHTNAQHPLWLEVVCSRKRFIFGWTKSYGLVEFCYYPT